MTDEDRLEKSGGGLEPQIACDCATPPHTTVTRAGVVTCTRCYQRLGYVDRHGATWTAKAWRYVLPGGAVTRGYATRRAALVGLCDAAHHRCPVGGR